MWPIANMVWAVGDIVDPAAQLSWMRQAGFDGAGFHACAGALPYWSGIDPAACDTAARLQWRRELATFRLREIHAPFEIEFRDGTIAAAEKALSPIIAFGGEVGADVITVHAVMPDENAAAAPEWLETMRRMNAQATQAGLVIGLEILRDFSWLDRWALPHIGVTLDTGHLFSAVGGTDGLKKIGGLSGMIRKIARHLVHLHVHDHNSKVDHIEVGTGLMDFADMTAGLAAIGYKRGMCLELNPSRVTPEGMIRSREYLLRLPRIDG